MASKTSNAVIIERIEGLKTLTSERFNTQAELINSVMDVIRDHDDEIHGTEQDIGIKMRIKRIEDLGRIALGGLGVAAAGSIAYLVNVAFLHIGIK